MDAGSEGRSRRYHDAELRRAARLNRVLYVLTVVSGVVYLHWLISVTDWQHPAAAVLFLVAELICFVCVLVWGDMLSEQRLHPLEGMDWKGEPPDVDLLITVCREPMEVVRPAFEAAAKIDYPTSRSRFLTTAPPRMCSRSRNSSDSTTQPAPNEPLPRGETSTTGCGLRRPRSS